MALKKKLNFLWILALYLIAIRLPKAFSKNPPRVPRISDPKFIKAFLDIHNELRRKVQPPAADMNQLFWDQQLAKIAKAWSRECKFSHNPCTSKQHGCLRDYDFIGENIYLGGIETQPENVVINWHNESRNYNFDLNTCSKVCGHYTQGPQTGPWVLLVGASVTGSSLGSGGNFVGYRPYTKGDSCSMCGLKTCENHLCRPINGEKTHQRAACHVLVLGFILQRLL
ncbi:GLIPR1-like protein 1 [Mus pahari]|uniref:GLIPR1-like protein 1 n=1 Tax=Mus pahari TaxID=10093 RepID=UPI000A30FE7C|nr:GLIPR1-like protein 1 [Mus pahari]